MSPGPGHPSPDPTPDHDRESLPQARAIAQSLVGAGGGAIRGILLFGSQLSAATPSEHSAWDLVVIVDDYAPFHRALVEAGHHRRSARLLTALAHILPPNITAFDPGGGLPLAKCAIVSARDFERALSARARDHFLKGRMVQQVGVVWTRSPADARWVREWLAEARRDVLRWSAPWQEPAFSAAEFALRMLRVSYRNELRPESAGRVEAVFEAQRPVLVDLYTTVLEEAEARGRLHQRDDGRWEPTSPAGRGLALRLRLYFLRSKARATLRWAKHVLTFNDWLAYIQRKVARRTGLEFELTPRERRFPFLFLWPKVFKVLAHRKAVDRSSASASGSSPDDASSLPASQPTPRRRSDR